MMLGSVRAKHPGDKGARGSVRLLILSFAIACAACEPSPFCDGAEAEAALQMASPGDRVRLGACEIVGPLHVPPGVTLEGEAGTVVIAPEGSGGIVALGADGGTTAIRRLEVRGSGRIGILARGGGSVTVSEVRIDAERGIGLGAIDLAELTLVDVAIEGPITEATASEPRYLRVIGGVPDASACPEPGGCECEPGDVRGEEACDPSGRWATVTATHGIYASAIAAMTMTRVDVAGFAENGIVLVDANATFYDTNISDTLGIGLRQSGGVSAIEVDELEGLTAGLTIERTYNGLRGDPSYAIAATDAVFEAASLTVVDNDRYGVFLARTTGVIDAIVAERNGDVALWIDESTAFALRGEASFDDNRFSAIAITASTDVEVSNAEIANTRAGELAVGPTRVIELGDGIHVHASDRLVFESIDLNLNERAGLVLDLGASGVPDVSFASVKVDAMGTQLGAVAGRPSGDASLEAEAPPGWDAGIERVGLAIDNDAAFAGRLDSLDDAPALPSPIDAVSVVAPMF
jgi:hypothetical protein